MLNLAEYRGRPTSLADFLPWAALVAEGVVLNKDGSFQRTARFRGPDLDSATPAGLVGVTARLNNALRRLGSGWPFSSKPIGRRRSIIRTTAFPMRLLRSSISSDRTPSRRPARISKAGTFSRSSGYRRRRTRLAPRIGSMKAAPRTASTLGNCCAASSIARTA